MKLSTSIKNALQIAERVKSVNGILGTPDCSWTAVRIKRMWLFGSTVKGKDDPSDTDILIDFDVAGKHQTFRSRGCRKDKSDYLLTRQATKEAFVWLRKGMKKISLHDFRVDSDLAVPRIMIYPRNDLAKAT